MGEPLVLLGVPAFAAAWLANVSAVFAAAILMKRQAGECGLPA
jgi:hypothetical protein